MKSAMATRAPAPRRDRTFLRVAAALSAAISRLHGRGLVHKDVKPANVLVHSAAAKLRLLGFGIASRLPREHQSPEPLDSIAAPLSYIAPEQTGRMNRFIDSRSDFSLGVTIFEATAGTVPTLRGRYCDE